MNLNRIGRSALAALLLVFSALTFSFDSLPSYKMQVWNLARSSLVPEGTNGVRPITVYAHPKGHDPKMLAQIPFGAKAELQYPQDLIWLVVSEKSESPKVLREWKQYKSIEELRRLWKDAFRAGTGPEGLPKSGGMLYVLPPKNLSRDGLKLVKQSELASYWKNVLDYLNRGLSWDEKLWWGTSGELVNAFAYIKRVISLARNYKDNTLEQGAQNIKKELEDMWVNVTREPGPYASRSEKLALLYKKVKYAR